MYIIIKVLGKMSDEIPGQYDRSAKYYVEGGTHSGPGPSMRDLRFVQARLRNVEMENDVLKLKVSALEEAMPKKKTVDLTDEMDVEGVGNVKAEEDIQNRNNRRLERKRTYFKLSDVDYDRPATGTLLGPIGKAAETFVLEDLHSGDLSTEMDDGLSWYKRKYEKAGVSYAYGTSMTAKGCVLVPKRQVVDFDYRIVRAMKYRKLHDFGYEVDITSSGNTDIDSVWHEFVSDYLGCLEGKTLKVDTVTGHKTNDYCFAKNNLSSTKFPDGWKRDLALDLYMKEIDRLRNKKQRQLHQSECGDLLRLVQDEAVDKIKRTEAEMAKAVLEKRRT
jgi:hypothetical protein